jgi:hypothetical protein
MTYAPHEMTIAPHEVTIAPREMMNAQQESKTPRITLIAQQVMATASHITVNAPCIMIKTLHKRVIELRITVKAPH